MSVLRSQDVDTFNTPVFMKESLEEAEKEAQSRRSILSPGDVVIMAIKML